MMNEEQMMDDLACWERMSLFADDNSRHTRRAGDGWQKTSKVSTGEVSLYREC